MIEPDEQERRVAARDADGVAEQGVAGGGRRRKRCVKEKDCRRAQRGKNKRRVGSHRHSGENGDGDETIDKHEERPDRALGKAADKVRETEPNDEATRTAGSSSARRDGCFEFDSAIVLLRRPKRPCHGNHGFQLGNSFIHGPGLESTIRVNPNALPQQNPQALV